MRSERPEIEVIKFAKKRGGRTQATHNGGLENVLAGERTELMDLNPAFFTIGVVEGGAESCQLLIAPLGGSATKSQKQRRVAGTAEPRAPQFTHKGRYKRTNTSPALVETIKKQGKRMFTALPAKVSVRLKDFLSK